jgi:hypothetical protein
MERAAVASAAHTESWKTRTEPKAAVTFAARKKYGSFKMCEEKAAVTSAAQEKSKYKNLGNEKSKQKSCGQKGLKNEKRSYERTA